MKRTSTLLLLVLLYSAVCSAQERKLVSILGDSYSTFQGYVQPDTNYVWYYNTPQHKTDVTTVTQTWWYKFIQDNNYQLSVNNSFSGATICNTGYRKADYSDRSFLTRMNQLGQPNIIFIFGATNDSWAGAPIGDYKYSDWTKEDLYQFRPAMANLLDSMTNHYRSSQIYFLLNDSLKESINESVLTICKHYRIDCISLHNIEKKGGHPSIKGMEQINDQIKEFLKLKGSNNFRIDYRKSNKTDAVGYLIGERKEDYDATDNTLFILNPLLLHNC